MIKKIDEKHENNFSSFENIIFLFLIIKYTTNFLNLETILLSKLNFFF